MTALARPPPGDYHQFVSRDAIIDRMLIQYGRSESTYKQIVNVLNNIYPYKSHIGDIQMRVKKLESYQTQLKKLLTYPLVKQKSSEWHAQRNTMITASDLAQALGKGKFGSTLDLIAKKCQYEPEAPFVPAPPLVWGNMFEPVASQLYSHINGGVCIHEFGLLPHPVRDYFGASPDGITELGVMLEIKSPYQRAITGDIPEQYMYQIQGQLEVCGLEECDYLECSFDTYDDADHFWSEYDETPAYKGIIMQCDEASMYSPIGATRSELLEWFEHAKGQNPNGTPVFWSLVLYSCIRVYRNQPFIEEKLDQLKLVWDRIQQFRQDPASYSAYIESNKKSRKKKKEMPLPDDIPASESKEPAAVMGYCFLD